LPHDPHGAPNALQKVVVVGDVVVVVVVVTIAGAQIRLPRLVVSVRLPNWSLHVTVGSAIVGHLSL
jgi:hypothetical protein